MWLLHMAVEDHGMFSCAWRYGAFSRSGRNWS